MNLIEFAVRNRKMLNKIYIILLVFIFSFSLCNDVYAMSNEEISNDELVFTGRIEKITTLNDKPRFNPWNVEVYVVSVETNGRNDLAEGDTINLYLHGIVRYFGGLEKDIIGKKYKFHLLETFSKNYSGKLRVYPME